MFGELGEVTAIIGLVINFLAVGTLLLNSRDIYNGGCFILEEIYDIHKICTIFLQKYSLMQNDQLCNFDFKGRMHLHVVYKLALTKATS